jgi:3-deoxy-D-manno-octulosonic-acid transferase
VFFKPWGSLMRTSLSSFTHFFVQDEQSKLLLKTIGFMNTTISGDTRFDRVAQIAKRDNSLAFMNRFLNGQPCLVAGST